MEAGNSAYDNGKTVSHGGSYLEGQGDLVIMEKKMEATMLFRVQGIGFRVLLGLHWGNGKKGS